MLYLQTLSLFIVCHLVNQPRNAWSKCLRYN